MIPKKQVFVTGQHDGWVAPEGVEYRFLEVLEFVPLPVPPSLFSELTEKPFDWIIFTSPRAVQFWTHALVSEGLDFPFETRVACIGEKTAEAAEMDGYTPDFYPRDAGTEGFVSEFKTFLKDKTNVRILLPGSHIARPLLQEELNRLGANVTAIATYETRAKENLVQAIDLEALKKADLFLFTSPSSVEAVCSKIKLPENLKVAAIGNFTKESLLKRGFQNVQLYQEALC